MKKVFIIFIGLIIIYLLFLVYSPKKTIIDIWDNLYCIETKCYEITQKDYITSYCFSKENNKICIVNH